MNNTNFSSFNTTLLGYNSSTGIWTCPETGRYDLSFFIHLESLDTVNGWEPNGGYFLGGICGFGATQLNVYTTSCHTIGPETSYIEISGSIDSFPIDQNQQLCLKVLNCSNDNYVSDQGDTVKMTIRQVQVGL
jgi:hypothetical protein